MDNKETIKVKVKVKCLSKYHAMKTYPVLSQTPHHDVCQTVGIAPCVLKHST